MSWYNGDYTLTRNGLAKVERAARRWGEKWRTCFDAPTSHEAVEATYAQARADRSSSMPDFLQSDEDYDTYQRECDFAFNLERACDAAHERLTPTWFDA